MDQLMMPFYGSSHDYRTPALLNICSNLQSGSKFMCVSGLVTCKVPLSLAQLHVSVTALLHEHRFFC